MSDAPDAPRVNDDDDDDALVAELRLLAAQVDPVPPEALAAAGSAIVWRSMDAELAELVDDGDRRLAGVRDRDVPTLLTFAAEGLTVELEVLDQAGRRRLDGQLVPPAPGTVEVRHRSGTMTVEVDGVGRFAAEDVAPGPVRLRCRAAGLVVETDWFVA